MEGEKTGERIKFKVPLIGFGLRILIFFVLAAGTAIAVRPLQLSLLQRMERLRDAFIERAEESLGRTIQYGSVGPSIFGMLDIHNLSIVREDDSVLLFVSRLRLSYSIVQLIRGNISDAFRSVRIDRPVLNLDFEKDADLGESLAGFRRNPAGQPFSLEKIKFAELLPDRFSLRIWNGEWELSGSAGNFRLHGLGFEAAVQRNRIVFNGRWDASGSLVQNFPALKDTPSVYRAAFRINGSYSEDSKEGSAELAIPYFTGGFFALKPLTFGVFYSGGLAEFRKIRDRSPFALSIVYDPENQKLTGRIEAENFSPGDLLTITGSHSGYNTAMAFKISGNAGFEMEGPGGLSYAVDLAGAGYADQIPGLISFAVEASGDSEHAAIETLDFHSAYGDMVFSGGVHFVSGDFMPIAPYGSFSLNGFRLHGDRGISGIFDLETANREITLSGKNLSIGNTFLSDLFAAVHMEENAYDFSVSVHKTNETGAVLLEGSMYYDSYYEYFGTPARNLHAHLALDSFSAGDILGIMEPLAALPFMPALVRSAAEDISFSTEVFISTDFNHIIYSAPRFTAAYEGAGNILAAVSLSGTDSRFELSDGIVSWKNGYAGISCLVDVSDENDISFSASASYKDLLYSVDGLILDMRGISLRGSYGLQAYFSAGADGEYTGYIQGDNVPVPSGDSYASLSFLVSLSYLSSASWRADIDRFQLVRLSTPASSNASLRFYGTAGETGLEVPFISFSDERGPLEGSVSLLWDNSYSYCDFMADMMSPGNNEYYYLAGTYRDEKLDLSFSGAGMQFSRFTAQNAMADGNFRLSWQSPSSFEAETVISSLVLYRNGEQLRVSAIVSVNSDLFFIRQLRLSYSGLEASVPFIRINRPGSLAEVELRLWGNFSGKFLDISSVRGEARFNPSENWPDLLRNFSSLSGVLTVNNARYDTIEAGESFSFVYSCEREKQGFALNLDGGPKNMIRFRYSPEGTGGSFYAALSAPSPVRGSVSGYISSQAIEAQTGDIYVDMGSLWRFIPDAVNETISFPGGIVNASVRITGSLQDPEFFGTARGTSLQILVPEFIPAPIRPAPIVFSLNGDEIVFGPVDAMVGQGRGKASAWFRFERWVPRIFSIDIQALQEFPVPYDFDLSGVLSHGLVSGKLVLAMEDQIFSITGDLTAHNTEISLDIGELEAAAAARELKIDQVTTIADLTVRTGRRVEFFWPSADFPVLQATADMGTGVRITSDNSSGRFTLTGDVKLRSGEIFYLERNFYLREGTLFFKENETEFDPLITARAEIRDQTEDGPVTISLIIENAPLMSFTPRFVSNPPLSQMEIYSLLGQNPQGDMDNSRNIAVTAIFDSLAQFYVIRRFQRQARDLLGLDMFSVRTQVLQNFVLQAAGAGNEAAVDRPYRVGNYFDNTTVFIGKYFGADLFGEAMLSIKYDENKTDWGGLTLEPEIGLEMRNPLFDIRFNLIPLHPENWFIDDVSLSLIWRRTF